MKNHKYHMKSHKFFPILFTKQNYEHYNIFFTRLVWIHSKCIYILFYHFQKSSLSNETPTIASSCTIEEFAIFFLSLIKSQTDEWVLNFIMKQSKAMARSLSRRHYVIVRMVYNLCVHIQSIVCVWQLEKLLKILLI